MSRNRATAIGFSAVLMWATLSLLTILSEPVPPLQLSAICFGASGLGGLVWVWRQSGLARLAAVPWPVYAFGTAGLFGYHFLYFSAFRLAPSAETLLIANLWPLLIVLFSSLLPGERLRPRVLVGALVAFAGVALLLSGRQEAGNATAAGLALGFASALVWASYSVLSRRFGAVGSESVTIYCLASAALAMLAHLPLEDTRWPTGAVGWLAVTLLAAGPVGLAFFTWDIGMKKGDIQFLGVASYFGPLAATVLLVIVGFAQPTAALGGAALMITGGAALAASRRPIAVPRR